MTLKNNEERDNIITYVRLDLYNKALPYGAKAMIIKMKELEVTPIPSLSTINRVLRENYLRAERLN